MTIASTILISMLAMLSLSQGAIRLDTLDYEQGNTHLQGFVAYEENGQKNRPGILIIHDWMGLKGLEIAKAKQMAELGYVAFAVDMYGKGIRPKDSKEAGEMAGQLKKDRSLMRIRIVSALKAFKKRKEVDSSRIASMGFCFGGTVALELARTGANVKGTMVFHGGLDSPNPSDGKKIQSKLLILHGAKDPFVSKSDIEAFRKELDDSNVDYQLVLYSGAVHAFTNPEAGIDPSKGAAYNPVADKRSWNAMLAFLSELFPYP